MLSSFQTSFTGAVTNRKFLEVTANNLANVNTTAFRGSRAEFADRLYAELSADNVGLDPAEKMILPEVGTGSSLVATSIDLSPGSLAITDNQFDLAILGNGFFQLIQPGGTTAYSRDGSFAMDSNRNLVNSSGYVLQPTVTVPTEAIALRISAGGVIDVDVPDPDSPGSFIQQEIGTIQLAVFDNDRGLDAIGSNLFVETAASGAASVLSPGVGTSGVLKQFALESSNVDVATEMTNIILAQRAYQLNLNALRQMDEMLALGGSP